MDVVGPTTGTTSANVSRKRSRKELNATDDPQYVQPQQCARLGNEAHAQPSTSNHHQIALLTPVSQQQGDVAVAVGPGDVDSSNPSDEVAPMPTRTATSTRVAASGTSSSINSTPTSWTSTADAGAVLRSLHRGLSGEAPGTSVRARAALVTHIVDESFLVKHDNPCCTMCLENVAVGAVVAELECGHVFHKGVDHDLPGHSTHTHNSNDDCQGVLTWLKDNNSCPQCRDKLERELPMVDEFARSAMALRNTPGGSVSAAVAAPVLQLQSRVIRHQTDIIKQQQLELAGLRTAVAALRRQQQQQQQQQTPRLNQSRVATVPQATIQGQHTTIAMTAAAMAFNARSGGMTQRRLSIPLMPPVYSWQVPSRDLASRMNLVTEIMTQVRSIYANSARHNNAEAMRLEQRLYVLAKKLEANFYRTAESAEAYNNRQTVKQRVANSMRQWGGIGN